MLVVDSDIIWGKPLLLKGSKIPYVNFSLIGDGFTKLENVWLKKRLVIKVRQL